MTKYRYNQKTKIRYPDDVKRIVKAFINNGMEITPDDAHNAWEDYSDEVYCAGWMGLAELTDENIVEETKDYFILA
jgi:hypothetical protein